MIPRVTYVIYGRSCTRKTLGVSLYRGLTLEQNIIGVITQDRAIRWQFDKAN